MIVVDRRDLRWLQPMFGRLFRRGPRPTPAEGAAAVTGAASGLAAAADALEAAGLVGAGAAAIVVAPWDTAEAMTAGLTVEPLVREQVEKAGLELSSIRDADERGEIQTRIWWVVSRGSVEELARAVGAAHRATGQYESLVRWLVFAFRDADGDNRPAYLIHNSRTCDWTPLVPPPGSTGTESGDCDIAREQELRYRLAGRLAIDLDAEPERSFRARSIPL